jgi:TRAP-type C4-dicarboxylate transport system permease small subunit
MRVYFSSEITRFLSSVTVVIAFAVFGFTVWKAVDLWKSDSNLQEIQELVNSEEHERANP